ncbi:hypothetical protein Tco_1182931 [Tanacetum coccineum]
MLLCGAEISRALVAGYNDMDDLYNNLKVYEPEVKGGWSCSSSSTQNMDFVSSSNNNTSSTNEAVNTAHGVSTASTQVNAAYSTNIDNLSDVVICAFFASQPNSPQLVHEDLQQIHPDDIEEIDLRWKMAMLTIRAIRIRKEQEGESACENIYFIALCHVWFGGYDWSDQAKEEPNYALMAFSSLSFNSKVANDSICSKSCLKTVERLKSQNDQLLKDLKKSELMVLDIKGLKFEIHMGEITIRELRKTLDIVQKEKDGIHLNVDKFEHASKSINKLIECQIVDNCKKGLGYENYNVSSTQPLILSFTSLDKFVNEPIVKNCKAMSSEVEPKVVRKNDDAPWQLQYDLQDYMSDLIADAQGYMTDNVLFL